MNPRASTSAAIGRQMGGDGAASISAILIAGTGTWRARERPGWSSRPPERFATIRSTPLAAGRAPGPFSFPSRFRPARAGRRSISSGSRSGVSLELSPGCFPDDRRFSPSMREVPASSPGYRKVWGSGSRSPTENSRVPSGSDAPIPASSSVEMARRRPFTRRADETRRLSPCVRTVGLDARPARGRSPERPGDFGLRRDGKRRLSFRTPRPTSCISFNQHLDIIVPISSGSMV